MNSVAASRGGRASRPLRLAMLMGFAPQKRNSMEDWLLGLAHEARRRGHTLHLFGREPVHPLFARDLAAAGAQWGLLDALEEQGLAALRVLRTFDVLHLNFIAPRSPVALAAYAAWPARVLYVAHSHLEEAPRSGAVRAVRRALDAVTLLRVEGLAGVSDFVRSREAERFFVPPARTRTLFNGVDGQRFHPPAGGRRGGREGLVLLTAAHLVRDKGLRHLLGAFLRLDAPGARLRIAGTGPDAEALHHHAAALGLLDGRVELLGQRDDTPELMREADLYVQPSRLEAFGLAVAEAQLSGCAVVATRVGGVPELVAHERTGLLVPYGSIGALAEALQRLVDDPALRQRLGEAGRAHVLEHFPLERAVREHLDWCEGRGSPHPGAAPRAPFPFDGVSPAASSRA